MKNKNIYVLLILNIIFIFGCARPQGNTPQQKREFIQNMVDETLANLYANNPEAQSLVQNAVGYGVFSDINTQILYFGTGNGYGVVTDNSDGAKTYMRMGEASAGLGVALTNFREVIIFNDKSVFNSFVTEGWDFGAQGEAVAKYQGSGGAATGDVPLNSAVLVYQITESGIALRANFSASKYWLDSDLNNY